MRKVVKAKQVIRKKRPRSSQSKRLSPLRRPVEMSLEQWQIALRRQIAEKQSFTFKNIGDEPFFSEYRVTNPETQNQYRVAIRGTDLGDNFCSCPDFAVNTLGTCKHIEYILKALARKRGGKKALAAGFTPAYSEVYLHYGIQREIIFRPGTDCPAKLKRLAGDYFTQQGRLKAQAHHRFDQFLKKITGIKHDLRCYNDALDFIAELRDQDLRRKRLDQAFPDGIRSVAFKRLLKVSLYPYQRQGALFAAQTGRCLLADDMGLGKTIQGIATAEILTRTMGIERVLIVCPTSLKHQWAQEITTFTQRSVCVVEGTIPKRQNLYQQEDGFFKITNYDVIHRDLKAINAWSPDLIILDEAQRIKNWQTRAAQSIKKLASPYALVLTGTPLENRLEELHSIIEFVDRYRLGPLFRFLSQHQQTDEAGKVVGYRHLTQISKSLAPILVRRTKEQVLKELPERLDKNYLVPMTSQQMEHHQENQEIVARIVAKWRKLHFLPEKDQLRLRIALQNMRMSCNSTYLLDQKTDHGVKADEFMAVLNDILEHPQAKVVVFSQWLRTHELLQRRLDRVQQPYILFHGQVPGPKRKALIQQFKREPQYRVFLSTDAGGVGLNLQNASTVINMDLPWNPAVLEQRIGRVHRLGQKQPVRVINFVSQGTIEQGMLSVLSFKKSLFVGVLDNGQDEVFLGGSRLKKFMETVEQASGAIPTAMPKTEGDIEDEAVTRQTSSTKQPGLISTSPQSQALQDLMTAGLSLVEKFFTSPSSPTKPPTPKTQSRSPVAFKVETDQATGKPCLKLPVPSKEIIKGLADLLGEFAKKI